MFQHFQADTLKQITQQGDNEKNRPEEMPPTTDVKVDMNTGMMSNPMNAKNKLQRISSFTTKKSEIGDLELPEMKSVVKEKEEEEENQKEGTKANDIALEMDV